MNEFKVLALGGSIRASGGRDEEILKIACVAADLNDYLTQIQPLTRKQPGHKSAAPISNTEVLAGAALLGARLSGAEIDYVSIKKLFPRKDITLSPIPAEELGVDNQVVHVDWLGMNEVYKSALLERVRSAQGLILASPVYFGDRGSVANKFMQFAQQETLFQGKVFGSVTAGAKRNGGQETTNIYALYEAINLGAAAVGNGPPTSQYGGTAVGGDMGDVCRDAWGLETCVGTGRRVSQVARLTANIPAGYASVPAHIVILVAMDTPDRLLSRRVQSYVDRINGRSSLFTAEKVSLFEKQIYRCLGCNVCPNPDLLKFNPDLGHENYACVINYQEDQMKEIREIILKADGILIAGANLIDMRSVVYRYQAFSERTRFIRHNNFELTNVPLAGLFLNEVGARNNPIFDLKVMTSYLRHNGIILPPVVEHHHQGKILVDGREQFMDFANTVQKIKAARSIAPGIEVSYVASGDGGYKASRLDDITAMRK